MAQEAKRLKAENVELGRMNLELGSNANLPDCLAVAYLDGYGAETTIQNVFPMFNPVKVVFPKGSIGFTVYPTHCVEWIKSGKWSKP
jgi:hypothetical protein